MRKLLDTYRKEGKTCFVEFCEWCWRRPVYFGLPILLIGAIPILAIDCLLIVVATLSVWGKQR